MASMFSNPIRIVGGSEKKCPVCKRPRQGGVQFQLGGSYELTGMVDNGGERQYVDDQATTWQPLEEGNAYDQGWQD